MLSFIVELLLAVGFIIALGWYLNQNPKLSSNHAAEAKLHRIHSYLLRYGIGRDLEYIRARHIIMYAIHEVRKEQLTNETGAYVTE